MTCEHCRRNPCGCVVVSDGTRYAPARRVCGEVFDAGGYPQGCTREPHEGDDHRADALVIAADLRAAGLARREWPSVRLDWNVDTGTEAQYLNAWRRVREPALSFIGRAANEGT